MSREILFKGKHIHAMDSNEHLNGTWVHGYLSDKNYIYDKSLEGEFLDYKNAIPRNNPILVDVENSALLQSLDRVSVVISEKLKSPVRCVFDLDRVYLSARTGNGEAKDICPTKGDGAGLEIGFNNRYLMEALRYAPADTVRFALNTNISPCVITPTDGSDSFLYMVLPVRLKAQ